MDSELIILGWVLVLALVQIFLTAGFRTHETGLLYNASARDEAGPPVGKYTARLQRAEKNLFETLPVFIAAVLTAHIQGLSGGSVLLGAQLYLAARIVYVPMYLFGIPYLRSCVWGISIVGILMIIRTIILP